METELQQAERIARGWADSLTPVGDLARVFLAQQARLAEVEQERDEAKRLLGFTQVLRDEAVERLAAAERKATEAAREALTRLAEKCTRGEMTTSVYCHFANDDDIIEFRDREYPAPTEREGARHHNTPEALLSRCANPADRPTPPQAAPEPLEIRVTTGGELVLTDDGYKKHEYQAIRLTPEDCRRIVETGRASGRGDA